MNTTTFKPRVLSPIQPVRPRQLQREIPDPVRTEIEKLSKTITLNVSFEPDVPTSEVFSEIPVAAIICTIKYKDRIIAQGRGFSTITRLNKSIERCAYAAFNGSWMSAAGHACRIFDTMHLNRADEERDEQKAAFAEAYRARHDVDPDRATDKQKDYARQLLSLNVEDEADREQMASTLDDMTKDEISGLIQRFAR
ncbi:hypothetical protein A3H16_03580 [Candidatus Kaiserbacteria bacterium RIFCSPLOWO2_12_FULL_53_8]|uniref:Uncharacterized protein n=2 Tax=Candidatus Kaiseribacteriota TaxID=1752734 RepID=A0A1F6CXE2_9BACT|nr:MAG: hypothetical protein A2851_01375 [Candidatus Kaiserbacteria bacterium RIFCSPHIGHO2_01_FULL_53_29]OGG91803.1 MAG: hypothetical protein A3H16_03580 [Candidatus Kaiserbacteria bacterium RIFCSPLOWO2_12_FULL_53_8]